MKNLAAIIVETFTMGTLTGDVFAELQIIFQNYMGDMGATPIAHINVRALQILTDRGFITASYNYEGRHIGYEPSKRALQCMRLELANGGGCYEPRDAFDGRLVVDVPVWCEAPASALGVSVNTR
jgi:hypothetical protein